jgi:beta-lactamase superfamily II metal-dependent hydrolase
VRRIPGIVFRRPLEDFHRPATESKLLSPITIAGTPDATVTILHSDSTAEGSSCAHQINNSSIVLLVEIEGVRLLFMGDAGGKELDDAGDVAPRDVEAKLLELEESNPGVLKADILKVSHHGSESAGTEAFIAKVDPLFVILSASMRHHLPKESVVERYRLNNRILLRTDEDPANDVDHIICSKPARGEVDCNYKQVLEE